jgi:hypothetical protein
MKNEGLVTLVNASHCSIHFQLVKGILEHIIAVLDVPSCAVRRHAVGVNNGSAEQPTRCLRWCQAPRKMGPQRGEI